MPSIAVFISDRNTGPMVSGSGRFGLGTFASPTSLAALTCLEALRFLRAASHRFARVPEASYLRAPRDSELSRYPRLCR